MTTERKAGWYHVKTGVGWECARWELGRWYIAGTGHAYADASFEEIGDRIPAPGGGWQCVPVEPTIEMLAALGWGGDVNLAIGHGAITAEFEEEYAAMLAAAPRPGGGDGH